MTLEMPRKPLRFVKLPSVVGATNAAVLSEHAQPDMHLLSDSEDTGSMSGDDSSENEQPATSSASEQKIKYDNLPDGEDQQYFVAHCSSMSQLLEDFHCPDCASKGLAMSIIKNEQMGYAAKVQIVCSACGYSKKTMSSSRLKGAKSSRMPFEVNRKVALLSHETGGSLTTLSTLSSVLGMPTMNPRTYKKHDSKVSGKCTKCNKSINFENFCLPLIVLLF